MVVLAAPSQYIFEFEVNPLPDTLRVNALPPAIAPVGLRLAMDGADCVGVGKGEEPPPQPMTKLRPRQKIAKTV